MAAGFSGKELPLVVIVGPTGSGKTGLAIKIAEEVKGEIICADSRTVYKYMDIGTAKPTSEEQAQVPHWGLDLVEPGEKFTVADFKKYANKKIEEIRGRGHLPFLVGGSGLYIDSVIFDYQFGSEANEETRQALQDMTLDELYKYCEHNNIILPENYKNKRYVIRAIEQKGVSAKRKSEPDPSAIIVGIATDPNTLLDRLRARTEQLFQNGVVEEATILGKKYGWEGEAMTGNIYRLANLYLSGELDETSFKEKNTTSDRRLSKRQLTWFRRNPFIKWLSLLEAESYLRTLLAKYK